MSEYPSSHHLHQPFMGRQRHFHMSVSSNFNIHQFPEMAVLAITVELCGHPVRKKKVFLKISQKFSGKQGFSYV